MPDKQPPITIRVTCDSCLQTFEIRKSNKPEGYPCPKCKITGVLHLAE
jgi:hypothetical protein